MNNTILTFIKELSFSTKIRAVASALGLSYQNVRSIDRLEQALASQPQKFVVDLEAGEDAFSAIQLARSLVPDVQIFAYYPHVERALGERAEKLGALVLPRSKFMGDLERVLTAR